MVLNTSCNVLLFGPHALSLDIKFFNNLYNHIHNEPGNGWILDLVSQLPYTWKSLTQSVPTLQHLNGEELLQVLNQGLRSGGIPESIFPLPNILLTPLTVIVHLAQYTAFLKAALPGLGDTDELPASITENTESLGLCTGTLSFLAVGCSSSLLQLQHYGSVAIRIAMLIGALVDANEDLPDSEGGSMSFSMAWNSTESGNSVHRILEKFPNVSKYLRHAPIFIIN
jgi:hypothetical protein